jgi:hypothetical protein
VYFKIKIYDTTSKKLVKGKLHLSKTPDIKPIILLPQKWKYASFQKKVKMNKA